jgi:hypothetical protein
VARFLPLGWWLVFDRVLRGRIDFFRRQQHECPYTRASRLANGKRDGCSSLIVRKIGDGEGVIIAEGEVKVLKPPSNALNGSSHSFTSAASALASKTLDPSTV